MYDAEVELHDYSINNYHSMWNSRQIKIKGLTTQSVRAFLSIRPVSAPSNSGNTRSTSSLIMNLMRSSSSMYLVRCKIVKIKKEHI